MRWLVLLWILVVALLSVGCRLDIYRDADAARYHAIGPEYLDLLEEHGQPGEYERGADTVRVWAMDLEAQGAALRWRPKPMPAVEPYFGGE